MRFPTKKICLANVDGGLKHMLSYALDFMNNKNTASEDKNVTQIIQIYIFIVFMYRLMIKSLSQWQVIITSNYEGSKVPEVLLSGNFPKIDDWRSDQAYKRTASIRPDLLDE